MTLPRRWPLLAVGLLVLVLTLVTRFQPGGLPFTPGARFSDAVTAHYPAALHLHRHGIWGARWRDNFFAGQPFSANPLNKTAYPPQWLVLVIDPLLHLNLMIVGHLALAAVGMWTWGRALGLSAPAAALATLAYTLSPRLMAHMGGGHLDVLYAMAWFPWLMWTVRDLVRGDTHIGVRVIRTALIAGLIVIADVRVSLFALTLASVYAIAEIIAVNRDLLGSMARRTIGVGALSFLLILPMIFPFLLWQPYLSRAVLTPADAAVFAMEPIHLIGVLFAPPGGNLEQIAYFGLPVLILAVIGLVRAPRRHALWIGGIAIAVLYALGESGGVWAFLVDEFPALLWFRVPARAWLVPSLLMPLLAGFGLDALLARAPRVHGLKALVIGSAALFMASDLLLFAGRWAEWRAQDEWLTPAQVELAETLIALDAGLIYSPTYSLETQTVAHFNLKLFGGVDPFQIAAINADIQAGGGIVFDGYSVVQPPLVGMQGDAVETANRDARPDAHLLGYWGVTHLVAAYPLDVSGFELVMQSGTQYIYRNTTTNVGEVNTDQRSFLLRANAQSITNTVYYSIFRDRSVLVQLVSDLIAMFLVLVCCVALTRHAILERNRRRSGLHET